MGFSLVILHWIQVGVTPNFFRALRRTHYSRFALYISIPFPFSWIHPWTIHQRRQSDAAALKLQSTARLL